MLKLKKQLRNIIKNIKWSLNALFNYTITNHNIWWSRKSVKRFKDIYFHKSISIPGDN